MTDVFISYKREEREGARRLAEALQKRGFSVWWDADILPGEQYRAVTLEILQSCRAAVVIWSPKSVQSSWVLDEAQRALDRGVLVPVLLEKIGAYPLGFGQVHAHDLTAWDGEAEHATIQPVIAAVQRLVGRPDSAQTGAGPSDVEAEVAFWRHVDGSRDAADFEAYLARYPQGLFAELAQHRATWLKSQAAGPTAPKRRKRKSAATRPTQPPPEAVAPVQPASAAAPPMQQPAPFSAYELAFVAACVVLTHIFAWPVVNTILDYREAFYAQDRSLLLNINSAQSVFVMPPLLVGLAWLYDRAKMWWASRGRSVQLAQSVVLTVLVLWFLVSLPIREHDGRETHFAIMLLCTFAAATYARPVVAWLRPRVERQLAAFRQARRP